MDLPGGRARFRAASDRPGADLVLADREEGDEVEQAVGGTDEARDRGLGKPQIGKEVGLVFAIHARDIRFDTCGKSQPSRLQLLDAFGQIFGHRLGGSVFGAVQRDQQRAVGQQPEAFEILPVELGLRDRPERSLALERGQHDLERSDLELINSLFAGAIQPFLDDLVVGENAFRVESLEIAERVGLVLQRRVVEIAQHEAQRFLITDLLEASRRESPLGRTVFARHVAEAHLRERGLPRREDLREPVDALVRHANHAEADSATMSDRDILPRHRIENSGLPRTGEADETDLHAMCLRSAVFRAHARPRPSGLESNQVTWARAGAIADRSRHGAASPPPAVATITSPESCCLYVCLGNDVMMVYHDVMTSLIRIQVQVTAAQADFLRALGAEEGRSLADLVREAVDGLIQEYQGIDPETRRASALGVVGHFRSGLCDVAAEHDRYLGDAFEA